MIKFDEKILIKIINIILIVIWMGIVFGFSNERGTKSSNTSRKVTVAVVQTISNKIIEENETLIDKIEKVIRKIAHYAIYTIGGFLIMNYAYTTNMKTKQKVTCSIIFGALYAVTDEFHQLFISGRSAKFFDVGIDTLGVITGILIYLITIKLINMVATKIQTKKLQEI